MSDSVWPHRRQPSGSPVPGILQARTLEWVAISFSNAWKWKVKAKSLSRVPLLATPWTAAHQAPPSVRFSRQKYWSGVPLPSPDFLLRLLVFPPSSPPAPWSLKNLSVFCHCNRFEFSRIIYRWKHAIWIIFCQASFIQHNYWGCYFVHQ